MNSRGLVIVAVIAIAILLVGTTAFSHSAEAKSKKKGVVAVSVKNWNCGAHDMRYRIQTLPEEKTVGLKTFNFWKHEIECDEPTFTLDVKYSAKGLHGGKKLFACVLDVDTGDSGCGWPFKYKPGKNLHTTVDLSMSG